MDVKRKKAGTKANPTNTAKATPETSWAERKVSRRDVLKGAVVATAGLVAGSGVIGGFPTVWAQKIKDIEHPSGSANR